MRGKGTALRLTEDGDEGGNILHRRFIKELDQRMWILFHPPGVKMSERRQEKKMRTELKKRISQENEMTEGREKRDGG